MVGLAVLLLVAQWPLVVGEAVPVFDADEQYAPWFGLLADHVRQGRLLGWDPWTSGGLPMWADPQAAAHSPLALGVGLIGGSSLGSFVAYWLLLWWLGGVGMLLLARQLGAPGWGVFVVGCGYMMGGFFTGHAQHTTFIAGAALLPWVLWRLDAALQARGGWSAARLGAQAGALGGLLGLSAYPGLLVIDALLVAGWCLVRLGSLVLRDRRARQGQALRRLRTGCLAMTLAVGVGAMVSGLQVFGLLYEGRGYTDRSEPFARADIVVDGAVPPRAGLSLVSPYIPTLHYLNDVIDPGDTTDAVEKTDASLVGLYAGAVPLCLAVIALVLRPRRWWGWRWGLLAIGLIALAAALGPLTPVRGWIWDLVPPTRYFRHAGMFRLGWLLSVAALAALGSRDLDTLLRRRSRLVRRGCQNGPRARRRVLVAGLTIFTSAAVLGVAALAARRSYPVGGPMWQLADLHAMGIWAATRDCSAWRCCCAWPATPGAAGCWRRGFWPFRWPTDSWRQN